MYKLQISISIKTEDSRTELLDEFELLLISYCKTGQILKDYEKPYLKGDKLLCSQRTLEQSSLSKKNNSKYVNQQLDNIERRYNSKITVTELAKFPSSGNVACTCKKPDFYVLFTHTFNDLPPIACGICRGVIPLYKLKRLTSEDRYNIFNWETNYKACDDLQLGCTVGEEWATKQMSDPRSPLSKQGLAICRSISIAAGLPVYYYLFCFKDSPEKIKMGKCPSCNEEWLIKDSANEFYQFLCKKCSLISSFV